MNTTIVRINNAVATLARIKEVLTTELIAYRYYQLLYKIFFTRPDWSHFNWKSDIDKVLEQLTFRERDTIRERFGLDNGEGKTLEELAVKFGVTRERVRQVELKALRRLSHSKRRLALFGLKEKINKKSPPVIITKIISGGITLDDLDLPTRIQNALCKAGYNTIEQLVNTPKAEFLKIKNIGLKSIEYMSDCLREKGVAWSIKE